MAGDKTIKRNIDKYTSQAFYTKAAHDHGVDVAYTFANKDDPKAITRRALIDVGIYFGENKLPLPDSSFNSKWILTGYNVGVRKAKVQKIENIIDNIDKDELESKRLEMIKMLITNHDNKFTKDEEDLINVGVYYKKENLELPLVFSNPLILLGYCDIPLDMVYNCDDVKHTRK